MRNIFITILLLLSQILFAQNVKVATIYPNTTDETRIMYQEYYTNIDKDNVTGKTLGRVADYSYYHIYKIPTKGLKTGKVVIGIGNRYRISVSKDNKNYKDVLVEEKDIRALSNYDNKDLDFTEYLPSDYVYIKFECSQPKYGFGSYLKEISIYGDTVPANYKKVSSSQYMKIIPYTPSEDFVLIKNENTKPELDSWGKKIGRIIDGSAYFTYKIYTKNLNSLVMYSEITNKFSISVSTDNSNWTNVLKINSDISQTPTNIGVILDDFLPADYLYIKLENPYKNDIGCSLREMTFISDKDDYFIQKATGAPTFNYNTDKRLISARKINKDYTLVVKDTDNNIVGYFNIKANCPLKDQLEFTKTGEYGLYVFIDGRLIDKSIKTISDTLDVDLIAPIFYIGETVKANITVPARLKNPKIKVELYKDGNLIKANTKINKNNILINNLTEGIYKVNYKINDAIFTNNFEVRKVTTNPNIVSLTKNGYFKLNNQPFVPMIMFLGSSPESVAQGFNVSVIGCDYYSDRNILVKENKLLLDAAKKSGTMVLIHLCNFFRDDNANYESLKFVVSEFKNDPTIFGWYIADEPSASVKPEKLEKAYKIIKEIDQNHPVAVLDNIPGRFKVWAQYCDVFSSDPYPIPDYDINMVADWTKKTMEVAPKKSIIMTLQGFGEPFFSRSPTFEEQKIMLDMALDNGAQAIGWWSESFLMKTNYFNKMHELTSYAKEKILKEYK